MKRMNIEKEIREQWFKNHKATLTQHGDITVLDWRKPGTGIYGVRYIIDGYNLCVTGDLGCAVFRLTWKAHIDSFNGIHIGYFTEKLSAFSDDRWDYNPEKAVARLKEWKEELAEYEKEYDEEKMNNLIDAADCCGSVQEWVEVVDNDHIAFISDLDNDYWEWMYDIGNEYPPRLRSYLIGLKMASAQLKEDNND